MCGIAGVFYKNGLNADPEIVEKMTRSLIHRGPDEEGYYCEGSIGFGHRRLSIIDLSSGQQPLCNEDKTIWITFNGEIYNYLDLKKELEQKGHVFRTNSDTETMVHAYEEWGIDAIKRFRGMFAFALWDEKKQQMVVARDRVGKKPFYYFLDDKRFIFASEIKAILAHPGIHKQIDLTSLSDYLSLLYVPSPKSIFTSIKKLPPAHYAVIKKDSFRVDSYWDLSFDSHGVTDENEMMEGLVAALDEATRIRMISEVPLGAFLSGGVDSSAVVAMMAKISPDPVITNSISFSVAQYNESRYAKKVSDLFGTNHHEMEVTPNAISIIEKLSWHYDEPFADSSAVPTYYVSKMARNNVTVSLSGDGGDENFAGYRRYFYDMRENMVRNLVPRFLRRPFFGGIGKLYPKADYLPQIFRGKAFISNVARDPVDAYFFSVSALYESFKKDLFKEEIAKQIDGYDSRDLFYNIYDNAPADDHLSKIQYLDIKTYLCDDILTKVDRASMAVSLEVRCPILDHKFMEYSAGIPSRLKLKGLEGKYIFKKALQPYLPDDILYRKKMGFGVPILEWLRTDIKEFARDLILENEATEIYFNRAFLEKVWHEHQRHMRNWSSLLWTIMMFNLWHKKFMETSS
ncbi:XrtA/PEP-CTERM system amidotransferase [Desulfobacter postgatei]|uniref:XrtA/PEP-CTERM system amidotransferase n=1 Tax=Desulfobacter postgatei TaxID=2293 RepID=UPI002A36E0D8|nr:XrtA/PEP-CTERM system amidotransferase [Desulfobacter postgatei]MDX9964212.1 amidotransferase 1, exosortase A system-associated [Desulfobacter postgatei]